MSAVASTPMMWFASRTFAGRESAVLISSVVQMRSTRCTSPSGGGCPLALLGGGERGGGERGGGERGGGERADGERAGEDIGDAPAVSTETCGKRHLSPFSQ